MEKRLEDDKKWASPIHNDIVLRWTEILAKGLPADYCKQLFKKHPTPGNCKIMEPPKINTEIKRALLDPKVHQQAVISRDTRIMNKQQKISVSLATLDTIMSTLLNGNSIETLSLIAGLSDVSGFRVHITSTPQHIMERDIK